MDRTCTIGSEGLSIGELAARTGVSATALRSWESRHGLLEPLRSPGGHRRYRPEDADLIEAVLRHREAGLGLAAAVEAARSDSSVPERSLFAELRAQDPHLPVRVLTKPAMLALSRAIEDESCARADRPVLFGFFQEQRFLAASASRWRELTRTADAGFVFAHTRSAEPPRGYAPAGRSGPSGRDRSDPTMATTGSISVKTGSAPSLGGTDEPGPVRIMLPTGSPLRREWALVCDAVHHPACLVGWERPDIGDGSGGRRLFEMIWSVEPAVVRRAAQFSLALVGASRPDLAEPLRHRLSGPVPPASEDLLRASSLLDRMIGYLGAFDDTTG